MGYVLPHRARCSLTLYPEAAEAGGCFEPTIEVSREAREAGVAGPARAQEEAARRAAAKVRRYCAANRLNRLATLTYARSCFDAEQLRLDVAGFFKGLRLELGGGAFPYLWVPEWHPGGHGLHVHFAVGRYVRQSLIRGVWARGITHIKLIGDLPVGSGALEEARRGARYLAKYASKNQGEARVPSAHRYEVAQGFQPRSVRLFDQSEVAVIGRASELMGGAPSYIWRSSELAGWQGPPAYWCAWSG